MDKVYLNVKTVYAFDTVSLEEHTAYTVYRHEGTDLQIASGWTLKDALELFSRIYRHDRESVKVNRPFIPQL